MDKRTILFFISLSLTLFVTNLGFHYYNEQKNQVFHEQQKQASALKSEQVRKEITEKTANASEFDIEPIFEDAETHKRVGFGILANTHLLVVNNTSLPKKIFTKNKNSPWILQSASGSEHELNIYGLNTDDKLNVNPIPALGIYDLQIVIPGKETKVYLGSYQDGKFTLPAAELQSAMLPDASGVAFVKEGSAYSPVGFYTPFGHQFSRLERIEGLAQSIQTTEPKREAVKGPSKEKFYVIETPYQQLVFSNKGGSLAEINLPFQSEKNQKSIVKEISFDREIKRDFPRDDQFPNYAYHIPGQTPQSEPALRNQETLGGFYPLIRRSMPTEGHKNNSVFYSLNLVSEYPEISEMLYSVVYFDQNKIVFEAMQPHRKIVKTFWVANKNGEPVPYTINAEIRIEGDSRGLWLSSGIPEAELVSGASAPSLKYRITRNQKSEVEVISLPKETLTVTSSAPDWISNGNGFFGIIMDPLTSIDSGYRASKVPGSKVPSRLVNVGKEYEQFKTANLPGYATMLPLPAKSATSNFRIYAGPYAESALKQVDAIYTDKETGYDPDYRDCISYHGWFAFISRPFAQFLLFLMRFFYSISGSWAISIILLTVALRIMLYPLNAWSMKSMAKMQQLAPEIEKLKKRYQKDPKKMQLEIAGLYREKGVNPLSGCFPILIQMPFLLGMFDLLKSTFELRGAPFIPGWIDNLAAPDVLFQWKQPILFFGNELHLLPFLLGLVMYLQQKFFSPQQTQSLTEEQKQQKAMMSYIMPAVFTFMFYNVPSGLNIYWLFSMLLGIPQQWWTNRSVQMKK